MGKNIFDRPLLKAKKSRNLFDVSHKTVFHVPFGAIVPCGHWRLAPEDKVEISEENQFVVPLLNRPGFVRLKEHIDYYFVSYNQLCTFADNFFTQQSYYWSSAVSKAVDDTLAPKVPNQMVTANSGFIKAAMEDMATRADIFEQPMYERTLQLLDQLGYGNMYADRQAISDPDLNEDSTTLANYPNVNLFNLLAYQKIYYDHFRNDAYESNKVYAYNIDDIQAGKVLARSDYESNTARYWPLFEPHYRWKKKDYFTNVSPNNLPDENYLGFEGIDIQIDNAGTVSVNDMINAIPNVGSVTSYSFAEFQNRNNAAFGNGVLGKNNSSTSPNVNNVNVQAIRFAFAYDKLLRRMREAGQDFDKQMLAQFGIKPIDQRHGKCWYIGGFTNRLNSSSVTVTSNIDTGNIAGNIDVYNNNNKPLHFTAKEHGILMAVYSTSLDFDYPSTRIDRENIAKHRFDWQHPAFENQGRQPIFGFEYFFFNKQGSVPFATNTPLSVLGLVDRYSEYKTHVDELHGLFCDNVSDAADFTDWVMSPRGQEIDEGVSVLTMKELIYNPNMLSNIIPLPYAGRWVTDPFRINMYHRVKKISNMSIYGEDFGH